MQNKTNELQQTNAQQKREKRKTQASKQQITRK